MTVKIAPSVLSSDFARLGEELADLQLPAAAPELLEALQFAIRFHDQLTPSDVARMRKVVDKATWSAA